MIRLLVGLGNPGPEYQDTRHNAGFWFIDEVARELKASVAPERSYFGLIARVNLREGPVWLLKPMTFMNLSGRSVGALARFFKIAPGEILVAHDELDLLPGQVKVSRSLRKSLRLFDIRVDTAFSEVMALCADPSREGRWITAEMTAAYTNLHELGWAHSVEAWHGGELLGGLYGLAVGGLFAGESMFHLATDASKCALVGLTDLVFADGDPRRIIDVQWATPHLTSLGVTEIARGDYLARLERSLPLPLPPAFDR